MGTAVGGTEVGATSGVLTMPVGMVAGVCVEGTTSGNLTQGVPGEKLLPLNASQHVVNELPALALAAALCQLTQVTQSEAHPYLRCPKCSVIDYGGAISAWRQHGVPGHEQFVHQFQRQTDGAGAVGRQPQIVDAAAAHCPCHLRNALLKHLFQGTVIIARREAVAQCGNRESWPVHPVSGHAGQMYTLHGERL